MKRLCFGILVVTLTAIAADQKRTGKSLCADYPEATINARYDWVHHDDWNNGLPKVVQTYLDSTYKNGKFDDQACWRVLDALKQLKDHDARYPHSNDEADHNAQAKYEAAFKQAGCNGLFLLIVSSSDSQADFARARRNLREQAVSGTAALNALKVAIDYWNNRNDPVMNEYNQVHAMWSLMSGLKRQDFSANYRACFYEDPDKLFQIVSDAYNEFKK